MDTKSTKALLSKLRQPVHIDYISKYILRIPENETRTILNIIVPNFGANRLLRKHKPDTLSPKVK